MGNRRARARRRVVLAAFAAAGVLLIGAAAPAGAATARSASLCAGGLNGKLANVVSTGTSCATARHILIWFAGERRQWSRRYPKAHPRYLWGHLRHEGWSCSASGVVLHHRVTRFGLVCTRPTKPEVGISATLSVAIRVG
ncbi:MAG: hypothetical protein JO304_12200 [Solirubrobacterales bacterium]|nr:hypothetical protein [Solirubrobacterales bacterium]